MLFPKLTASFPFSMTVLMLLRVHCFGRVRDRVRASSSGLKALITTRTIGTSMIRDSDQARAFFRILISRRFLLAPIILPPPHPSGCGS